MLERLLAVAGETDFEDCGSLRLTGVEWSEAALTLSLHVAADEHPEFHPRWQIVCSGVREYRLSPGYSPDLQLYDDHVLLWPHTARRTSTSFYGRSENPPAVAGALYERHWELAGEWIPFHRFLNSQVGLTELIAGGFGMLAEGPEPLILAYEEVMRGRGFLTSHLDPRKPVYWGGGAWLEEEAALSALVLGRSYVVAESFTEKAV